jgi:hypothetical protein
VGRDDPYKAVTLEVRIVPVAKHDVNGVALVPQIGIARNHRDVFGASRRREARSDFANDMRQTVNDA